MRTAATFVAIAIGGMAIASYLPTGAVGQGMPRCCDPRTPISDIPFTITKPGSYYATKNLAIEPGDPPSAPGIQVNASNVSIDLNGFELVGEGPASGRAAIAIDSLPARNNITIINGNIHNWDDGAGIAGITGAGDVASTNCTVRDVRISDCLIGMDLGRGWVITRCSIEAGPTSVDGIKTKGHAVISECRLGSGVDPDGTEWTFQANGIVSATSVIARCVVSGCLGNGITSNPGSNISECVTSNNNIGIAADDSLIRGNAATSNTTTNITGNNSVVLENRK